MDSLTAHYLARELGARWAGRRVTALRFDRDAHAVLLAVDGAPPVRFPVAGGGPMAVEGDAMVEDALHLDGWTAAAVSAPEDDRRLRVEFERRGKFRGSPPRHAVLEISFVPNARGARLTGDAGESRLGARLPPVGAPRRLLSGAEVAEAVGAGDRGALLGGRWMSAAVIEWLGDDPPTAAERYARIVLLPEAPPPPVGARIAPPGAVVEETPASPPPDDKRARAIARMERELAAAAAMPLLREAATLLFALGDAPAPREVALSGGPFPFAPRPGERATQAAERLLDEARSMDRALTTLPARIAALRAAPANAIAPPPPKPVRARAPRVARPYREYRTSGGLDLWVGRGAASNDELTFHIADPEDVWLHARDAAGAHVVLRWTRADPPPPRDLAEAAAIAAWHSKSRGSTVTPVDWTRRKHVRKPRGGPPGLVLVDKVKTVNARPSAAIERALRREE